MTTSVLPGDLEIEDPERFALVLEDVIELACENGVSVDGGWLVQREDDLRTFDVVITEVERAPRPDRTRR